MCHTGYTGPQGEPGRDGNATNTGATGNTGAPGQQGNTGSTGPIDPNSWLLNGNLNAVERYIGTNDAFDFPVRTFGSEVARFTTTGRFYVGQTGQDNGSSAGIQVASTTANQSQYRSTQYGNNAGVPGISTLKSRGTSVGSLVPVQVGDAIFGITAVGVTNNSSSGTGIPLAAQIQIIASATPAAPVSTAGYIGTDYILALVSKNGPQNGRRRVFRINSEGVPSLYEQNTVQGQPQDGTAGLVTFTSPGSVTVLNANVTATSRITLTVQDGAAPVSAVYVSGRTVGTSFTIGSIGAANPVGLVVYWQIWEPMSQTP